MMPPGVPFSASPGKVSLSGSVPPPIAADDMASTPMIAAASAVERLILFSIADLLCVDSGNRAVRPGLTTTLREYRAADDSWRTT